MPVKSSAKSLAVGRADVWSATIEDQPGSLTERLSLISTAGTNLEFIIGRRVPDHPGTAVVFLAPIKGPRASRAARAAGFSPNHSHHLVRVEAPNRSGLTAEVTSRLAGAGLNIRGLSASSIGRRGIMYFAFASSDDAGKAVRLLKKRPARTRA